MSRWSVTTPVARSAFLRLAAIADLPVRVGAVARHARIGPKAFVSELELLLVASSLGSSAAADAALACALWLLDQEDACVAELHAMALRGEHALVSAVLANAPPHRGLAVGGRLSPLDIPATARVVRRVFSPSSPFDDMQYLIDGIPYALRGSHSPSAALLPKLETADEWQSWFARLQDEAVNGPRAAHAWRSLHPPSIRRAVTRLGRHHSAFTIGRLLDDPAVRERDAIAIASRRPTTPAIVRELTSRPRWIQLANVRAALVANPCTPTRVALLLAATCWPRLRGIAAAGNVHPLVRELARLGREAACRSLSTIQPT